MAERLPYFKDRPDRFDTALEHLVRNNIFLYYPDIHKDMVFCDPQCLLDEVSEIVKQHYKLVNSAVGRVGALLMFEKQAYISDEILKQILPQYNDTEYIFKTGEIFKLLTKLNIISEIYKSKNEIYYLMPALLSNTKDPIKMAQDISNERFEGVPPLCISFDGCAPSGLFCSLMAHLLQSEDWELCMNDNTPTCCYRNCVVFICRKRTVVTLVDSFSHFMIYIKSPYIIFPNIIKEMFHNSIAAVAKHLSFEAMKYEDAIECPEHPGQHDHVAVWHHTPDEEYVCKKDDSRNGPVDQKYHLWREAGIHVAYKGRVGRDYTQVISRGRGCRRGKGTLRGLCNVFSRSALKYMQLIFTKIVCTNIYTETSHILLCWYIGFECNKSKDTSIDNYIVILGYEKSNRQHAIFYHSGQ